MYKGAATSTLNPSVVTHGTVYTHVFIMQSTFIKRNARQ
jgi:hypothetical protein